MASEALIGRLFHHSISSTSTSVSSSCFCIKCLINRTGVYLVKWVIIVPLLNLCHSLLAIVLIGLAIQSVLVAVFFQIIGVFLVLVAIYFKIPFLLVPNIAIKMCSIAVIPVTFMRLRIEYNGQVDLVPHDAAIILWIFIAEFAFALEVILCYDTFHIMRSEADREADLPPAYSIAIIDTELPTYDQALKLISKLDRPLEIV